MRSNDGDSDIDKQLEAEMQRSQQLKKNLIDVLEVLIRIIKPEFLFYIDL